MPGVGERIAGVIKDRWRHPLRSKFFAYASPARTQGTQRTYFLRVDAYTSPVLPLYFPSCFPPDICFDGQKEQSPPAQLRPRLSCIKQESLSLFRNLSW